MADRGKAQVVDGRMLILSMRQAAKDGEGKPPLGGVHGERKVEMSPEEPGNGPKTVGGGLGGGGLGHIGKTTQPTKRTIRCFECGYECQMTGTTKAVYCSKCRAKIEMGDVRVEGEWTKDVQTGGDVRVAPGARVLGAKIRAGNVKLEGELDGYASVECGQWLELATPTPPRARQVATRNLRLAEGCEWAPGGKLQVHHLELRGTLEADVEASGHVLVMAGGCLRGSLRAAHLQVEEGGGVEARLFVWAGGGGGA